MRSTLGTGWGPHAPTPRTRTPARALPLPGHTASESPVAGTRAGRDLSSVLHPGLVPLCGLDSVPLLPWWDPRKEVAGSPERMLRREARRGRRNESCDPGTAPAPPVSPASPGDPGRGHLQLNGKGAGSEASGSLCPQGSSASSRLLLRQTDATPTLGPSGSPWDRDRAPRSGRPAPGEDSVPSRVGTACAHGMRRRPGEEPTRTTAGCGPRLGHLDRGARGGRGPGRRGVWPGRDTLAPPFGNFPRAP